MPNTKIKIELTRPEALVLFEFVSRFSEDEVLKIEDQAEERVLWNLCASLESLLSEPFAKNYGELLANARSLVRDKG